MHKQPLRIGPIGARGIAELHSDIRVLIIDRHQLLLDSLSQWLFMNAPGIAVRASASAWPLQWVPGSSGIQDADVAVVGELNDDGRTLADIVASITMAGMQVVLLVDELPLSHVQPALDAGALAIVPKSADPGYAAAAIRAAASGRQYIHPDIEAMLESGPRTRVILSEREQRIAMLYLRPEPHGMRGVAELLGISQQTVKSHLHRVRRRYAAAGIDVGNVLSLQDRLRKDGWLA